MQFVEAFEHLGYRVIAPRQDWSAEKDGGVCISLWKKEMGTRGGLPWMNTQVHADPIENWGHKPGNVKRNRHLGRALEEFGGRVDVVIVSGIPGKSYARRSLGLPKKAVPTPTGKLSSLILKLAILRSFWSRQAWPGPLIPIHTKAVGDFNRTKR